MAENPFTRFGLRRKQSNELFAILEKYGFDPKNDFEVTILVADEGEKHLGFLFKDRGSFRFVFWPVSQSSGSFSGFFCSPGSETLHQSSSDPMLWDEVHDYFVVWVQNLAYELEQPDFWQTGSETKRIIESATSDDIENTPFSPEEQKALHQKLDEIKNYVLATHNLNEEQAKIFTTRFDYLKGSTARVGRKDWFLLALGTLSGYYLQLALPPEALKDVIKLTWGLVSEFFGVGLSLLHP